MKLKRTKNKAAVDFLAGKDFASARREELSGFAQMAWEAGYPALGLKILSPNVNLENPNETTATSLELFIYAYCLLDLGANKTALGILKQNRSDWPVKRNLALAKAFIQIWEPVDAVPLLKSFLQMESISEEDKAIALDLLLFCYRYLWQFEEALELIKVHHFPYQSILLTRHVLSLHSKQTPLNNAELKVLKDSFKKEKNYRAVREIDFHKAVILKDEKILGSLFFGTPYGAFYERIKKELADQTRTPSHFSLENVFTSSSRTFDLYLGRELDAPAIKLKLGQVLHRIFAAVLSDFYEPMTTAALFEAVFPEEVYHPLLSASRIHQLAKRLKSWIKKSNIPLVLEQANGAYWFRITGPYRILISKEQLKLRQEPPLFGRLQVVLPHDEFTIRQAADALGLSRRFARKVLESAEKSGWVEMKGRGRTTRYEFKRLENRGP